MTTSNVSKLGDGRRKVEITFSKQELEDKMQKVLGVLRSCTHGPHEGLAVAQSVVMFLKAQLGVTDSYTASGEVQ